MGNRIQTARKLQAALNSEGISFAIVNIRWLKPLPKKQLLQLLSSVPKAVTLEEYVLNGGFGSSIAELICDYGLKVELLRSGIDDTFVEAGTKEELDKAYGIDTESLLISMRKRWSDLFK